MEILELFALIWEHRNTHAFMAILAYMPIWMPALVLFIKVMEAREMASIRRGARSMASYPRYKHDLDDFEREVKAWEAAARQHGRDL